MVRAWQVVGTCAEAAPLGGSTCSSVCGVSSLMSWLTDCQLTDRRAWVDPGLGEEAVRGYGSPEALAAVPALCPWLGHLVPFLLLGRHQL